MTFLTITDTIKHREHDLRRLLYFDKRTRLEKNSSSHLKNTKQRLYVQSSYAKRFANCGKKGCKK